MKYPPTPMTTRATAISTPAMIQWSFDPPVGSVIQTRTILPVGPN